MIETVIVASATYGIVIALVPIHLRWTPEALLPVTATIIAGVGVSLNSAGGRSCSATSRSPGHGTGGLVWLLVTAAAYLAAGIAVFWHGERTAQRRGTHSPLLTPDLDPNDRVATMNSHASGTNSRQSPGTPMTIGVLSRRTGVSVKILREYEDLGLIYTVGRSPGNYRLLDDEALWCVGVVEGLRSLGLTMAEIVDLTEIYLHRLDEPVGPRLAAVLATVRDRTQRQISELRHRLERIDAYVQDNAAALVGREDLRDQDPRLGREPGS